jgi:hypothetical protein
MEHLLSCNSKIPSDINNCFFRCHCHLILLISRFVSLLTSYLDVMSDDFEIGLVYNFKEKCYVLFEFPLTKKLKLSMNNKNKLEYMHNLYR